MAQYQNTPENFQRATETIYRLEFQVREQQTANRQQEQTIATLREQLQVQQKWAAEVQDFNNEILSNVFFMSADHVMNLEWAVGSICIINTDLVQAARGYVDLFSAPPKTKTEPIEDNSFRPDSPQEKAWKMVQKIVGVGMSKI